MTTKKPIGTLSDLFEWCKWQIQTDRYQFICHAIRGCPDASDWLKEEARQIVTERINGYCTYTAWVASQIGRDEMGVVFSAEWFRKAKEGRVAWLQSLSEEFKGSKA